MIERGGSKRQIEDVRLPQRHVALSGSLHCLAGLSQRRFGYVDGRDQRLRTVAREGDCLGAHSTAGLKHAVSLRVARIRVQELDQRGSLVLQPQGLSWIVSMHVVFSRTTPLRAQGVHGGRASLATYAAAGQRFAGSAPA